MATETRPDDRCKKPHCKRLTCGKCPPYAPLSIHAPLRRKLKQNARELCAERGDARKEFVERRTGIAQLLIVRDETACLDGEPEIGRRGVSPGGECLLAGELVKAVVDLDRIKLADVERKHLPGWCLGGIKRSAPVHIVPSGGADPYFAGHLPFREQANRHAD